MERYLFAVMSIVVLLSFRANAKTTVVDSIAWSFTVSAGRATIEGPEYGASAISDTTTGEIAIPEMLDGYPVTYIGDAAFSDCSLLTSVVIPEGVTSIGSMAFSGCSSLTSVVIPDSVTSIDSYAFSDCSSLTSVVIPDSVTSIDSYAFSDCSSLTSMVIPKNVKSISYGVFDCCSSLTSVVIPEGVRSIGGHAFWKCSSLESIVIPSGVTSIGNSAFWKCSSLESIVIPSGVTSIGNDAFSYCSLLKSVIFKGDVPAGFSDSGLLGKIISFPQEYGADWEKALNGSDRGTFLDIVVPAQVTVQARAEAPTPKTIKVTYTVKSELPSVKVRAVAWKDGVRSFANIVPVRTGEGVPRGESVSTNEEHSFVWDAASDWATDLDKVAVEILVQEGTLLPQELITIPATKTHKAMTITRNALAEPWLFDALVWCFAEGDSALTVENGNIFVHGQEVGQGGSLCIGTNASQKALTLLNFLYGKMGYKVLAGEELLYAKSATRLTFADSGLRQVSVKIEEGE